MLRHPPRLRFPPSHHRIGAPEIRDNKAALSGAGPRRAARMLGAGRLRSCALDYFVEAPEELSYAEMINIAARIKSVAARVA
jgi:hypothetical protein